MVGGRSASLEDDPKRIDIRFLFDAARPRHCSGTGVPARTKCIPVGDGCCQVRAVLGCECCQDGGEGGREGWFRMSLARMRSHADRGDVRGEGGRIAGWGFVSMWRRAWEEMAGGVTA